MSTIVLNPNKDALMKEVQGIINKWYNYIKTIDTDYRIIRDDEGEIVALAPRIHVVFKDTSDFVLEVTTSGAP